MNVLWKFLSSKNMILHYNPVYYIRETQTDKEKRWFIFFIYIQHIHNMDKELKETQSN